MSWKDLGWWHRKMVFKPSLQDNQEVQDMLDSLTVRICSFSALLCGDISLEMLDLDPNKEGLVLSPDWVIGGSCLCLILCQCMVGWGTCFRYRYVLWV